MTSLRRLWAMAVLALVLIPGAAWAQEEEQGEQEETPQVEDVIVVTASRTEQRLQEVPVAMTVISAAQLENSPADDYGDVLRSVPGLNISQISARDVQIAGRSASSSLSTSQLVLLDGRSVYLDFFGFVMWDLLPVDFREIAQVEVVRGPGSAVWGANALGGVVNLITKSPWELSGTSVTLGGGELGTLYGSISHARSGEDWGLKASASYSEQDPYDRPTGVVPGSSPPTQYPPFANEGTEQPKIDLRFDKNINDGESILSTSLGWAETDGIVHSGIGPFNINKGSGLNYGKVEWSKGALNIGFWANFLDGDATNLLTVGLDGLPLPFFFVTDTYNLDLSNSHQLDNHTITYGGNYREIDFELSLAQAENSRTEMGVFLQDEIQITDKLKWLVGARWDDIDPVGSVVSPRTSLLFSPSPDHNFRMSYNQAFRAPSLVENYLDVTIFNAIDVGAILRTQVPPSLAALIPSIPYAFPTRALGNPQLQEEQLTAYEVGYVGSFADGRVTMTLAAYRNELEDGTDFFAASAYGPAAPPFGWPPQGALLNFLLSQVGLNSDILLVALDLPSSFTYRNIGEQVDKGIEFSFDYRPSLQWSYNFNYSFQDDPEFTGISALEKNSPPTHRANISASYNGPMWFVDGSVNYVDEAYWTDVLDSRFFGTTDEYTLVNLSVGVNLMDDKVTLSLMGNNIFDEDVQQHVFGDIISRKIVGQVRFVF